MAEFTLPVNSLLFMRLPPSDTDPVDINGPIGGEHDVGLSVDLLHFNQVTQLWVNQRLDSLRLDLKALFVDQIVRI